MDGLGQANHLVKFQGFELNLQTGELRKSGTRIKLQDQPFKVLAALVQRPGQLVTREELRRLIWPEETFGDFDHAINLAVAKLRGTLGDSADVPHLIETLPRRGYRFVGVVERAHSDTAATSEASTANGIAVAEKRLKRDTNSGRSAPVISGTEQVAQEVPPVPKKKLWRIVVPAAALFLAALVAGGLYYRSHRAKPLTDITEVEVVPLTGMAGMENYAAFSRDGNQVAFSSSGKRPDGDGIYTVLIGGERPLRLTSDSRDCCPVWSPDGRAVAFARSLGDRTESGVRQGGYSIYTVPALGGTPRMVYSNSIDFPEHIGYEPTFTWSPDGTQLAISAVSPSLGRPAITLLSLEDLSLHPITAPPREFSDWGPAFSSDGKSVAFLRSSGPGLVEDLYVVPATGGEARRLTFDNRMIAGPPAWSPDGRDIVFASARAGPFALWRIGASGGAPQRVEGVGTSVMFPAVSPTSYRLAYTSVVWRPNLWSVRLIDPKHAAGSPQLLFASKGAVGLSYFSADGEKIVFESSQSGYDEIWTVNSDGSDPTQLTFLAGESGTPRWSYDGRSVAFDYRPSERSEIYIVENVGGRPRIFPTNPGANNVTPSWSRDGHWIYFSSSRGNEPIQVWKAHYPEGGTIQLTQNGGTSPIESADGFLYYSKSISSDEIWKIPVDGGPESLVLKAPALDCWCKWALALGGIYFIAQRSEPQGTLFFYDFAAKKLTEIVRFEKYTRYPAISPDGRFLIYTQVDQTDQTIMLVNHFH